MMMIIIITNNSGIEVLLVSELRLVTNPVKDGEEVGRLLKKIKTI
jgi:hypothetical protein